MCAQENSSSGSRLFEKILEDIKAMIINSHLSCGDRLPSERELAERFGVSRVPVREALKVLEYIGILDGSQGSGLYIRNVDMSDLYKKLNFAFITTTKTITELMEVRISLEADAAYFAALRRSPEDLFSMQQSLLEMRRLKRLASQQEEDVEELRRQSNCFHMAIIQASKNSVLQTVYASLLDLLHLSRQYTFTRSTVSYNSLLAHEAIYDKILAGDAESARICMAEHLTEAKEVFDRMALENTKNIES